MDMKEEKVKKLKEQFKKIYLDTVKHANDIEKWINSGKRKQGDIRRSIERLESKYQSLLEIKKDLINQNLNEDILNNTSGKHNNINLNRIENELKFNELENKIAKEYKIKTRMDQIQDKIEEFYQSIEVRQSGKTENEAKQIKNKGEQTNKLKQLKENEQINNYYDNNIESVYDISGNENGLYYLEKRNGHHRRKIFNIKESIIDKYYEIKYRLENRKKEKISQNKNNEDISEYEQYCAEMKKGPFKRRIEKIASRFFYTRKNKKGKNIKYKKVGRISALLMAGALALFGGTTAGESNANTIKNSDNDKSYVDINKGENDFKKSLYVQSLEETTNPSKVKETTVKMDKQKEIENTQQNFVQPTTEATQSKINRNQNEKREEKMQNKVNNKTIEYKESADDVYILKANEWYTENSLGEGASGYVSKDKKVKKYNSAFVNTKDNKILYVTEVGQTWEEFTKKQGIDYEEFKNYIDNNPDIKEMYSLDDLYGNQLGWVSKDKLEKVEIER